MARYGAEEPSSVTLSRNRGETMHIDHPKSLIPNPTDHGRPSPGLRSVWPEYVEDIPNRY